MWDNLDPNDLLGGENPSWLRRVVATSRDRTGGPMFPLDPNDPTNNIDRDAMLDSIVANQNGDEYVRPLEGNTYATWEDATEAQRQRTIENTVDDRVTAAIEEFTETEWPTLSDRAAASLEAYARRPVESRDRAYNPGPWWEPRF